LGEGPQATALHGLFGSAKGLVISALARRLADRKTSVLVVTPTDEDADRLHADVTFFHRLQGAAPDDILLFPDWGVLPDASTPPVEVVDSACACWTGSSERTAGSCSSRRWRRSCNGSC